MDVGTVLRGRGPDYERDWKNTDFYSALETHRPASALAHSAAVFAVDDPDLIDVAGGATDWIFELASVGKVSAHDINWSSEISCLLSEGHHLDSPAVITAAKSYWAGVPHPNESVWEYLIEQAVIIRVGRFEDFDWSALPCAAP